MILLAVIKFQKSEFNHKPETINQKPYFMKVELFTVGPLGTNCYLVTCEKTNQSVIVDPGGISEKLIEAVKKTDLSSILLTHGHFDHIQGVGEIAEITGAPVMIHQLDSYMLTDPVHNGSFMIGAEIKAPEASQFLCGGDEVTFGESSLKVVHTPGHTEGGISFVDDNNFIIGGDTLFRLSVGRWDLPGGDYETLVETLRSTFLPLPGSMELYPGHGDISTIGFEKTHNQFLK